MAERYSLKWAEHMNHLNSSVSMLYRCEAFTDVLLATSDGYHIPAHQFVLSASSAYLHKIFLVGGSSLKGSTKLIVILPPDIGHTTLGIILQYIYKGEAVVSQEQVSDVMKAAEILQVRGLYPVKNNIGLIEKSSLRKTATPIMHNWTNNVHTPQLGITTPEPRVYNSESPAHTPGARVNIVSPEAINTIGTGKIRVDERTNKSKLHTVSSLQRVDPKIKFYTGTTELRTHTNTPDTKDNNITNESRVCTPDLNNTKKTIIKRSSSVSSQISSSNSFSPDTKKSKINETENRLVQNGQNKENPFVQIIPEHILMEEMVVGEEIQVVGDEVQIKDEPVDVEEEDTTVEEDRIIDVDIVKEEVEDNEESNYFPLSCHVCQETFKTPSLWVRHIESNHPSSAFSSVKRTPLSNTSENDDSAEYTPLKCDICLKVFTVPAEWVRHVEAHSEEKLHQVSTTITSRVQRSTSASTTTRTVPILPKSESNRRFLCTLCNQVLESQQSHACPHSGKRVFICIICHREFSKTNFVRHMHSVHNQIVKPE